MKNILKLLFVGIITTIFRIIGQLLIPSGEQAVLKPSVFVKSGSMPLAFTLYGILSYTLIASMFLLIYNKLTGNKILQGLKYGFSCCLVWVVYLFEPLPHVAPLDRITYPLADGIALLIMGVTVGLLFAKTKSRVNREKNKIDIIPLITITVLFIFGRFVQYLVFSIYSSFNDNQLETIIWCIVTGFIIACVMIWLNQYVKQVSRIAKALIVGGLLFGLDLLLFNFFMPLVFNADIPDLILRTAIDIAAVTSGCLALSRKPCTKCI